VASASGFFYLFNLFIDRSIPELSALVVFYQLNCGIGHAITVMAFPRGNLRIFGYVGDIT